MFRIVNAHDYILMRCWIDVILGGRNDFSDLYFYSSAGDGFYGDTDIIRCSPAIHQRIDILLVESFVV
jgi:hypothetical protein